MKTFNKTHVGFHSLPLQHIFMLTEVTLSYNGSPTHKKGKPASYANINLQIEGQGHTEVKNIHNMLSHGDTPKC